MSYLLFDLIAAAIIVLFTVWGYSRGFIKTFFGLFGFIIAIVIALVFTAPLASFLRDKVFEPALSSFFLKELSRETGQSAAEVDFSALPAGGADLFSRFGMTAEALAGHLLAAGKSVGQDVARSLAEAAVAGAAMALSRAVAFLSLFIMSVVLIRILARVLDLVAKLPVLHLSNRVFGLLAGLGEGLAIAFVFSRVLALLEPSLKGSDLAWLRNFSMEKTHLIRFLSGWDL